MQQKIKKLTTILLCVCLMSAFTVRADSDGASKTIYPAEYGMMMTFVSMSSESLYSSVSIDRNSDGAELLVSFIAYEWYDEEDYIPLDAGSNRDLSGTATRVYTTTFDDSALTYSNYVFVSGTVRNGSTGKDYTDHIDWWVPGRN